MARQNGSGEQAYQTRANLREHAREYSPTERVGSSGASR
jgi:hypothetical protein